jgi:hypothetical protein
MPSSSAGQCHLTRLVPSSWFFATSTVYATYRPAGLLHPAADSGVHFVRECFRSASTLQRFPLPRPVSDVTIGPAPHVRCRCWSATHRSVRGLAMPLPTRCSQSTGYTRGWEACFPCPHRKVSPATRTRCLRFPRWTPGTRDLRSPLRRQPGFPDRDARSFLGLLAPLQGPISVRCLPRGTPVDAGGRAAA